MASAENKYASDDDLDCYMLDHHEFDHVMVVA